MLSEMFLEFVQSHPVVATVLTCVGAFRVCLKPLTEFLKFLAAQTPTTKDDEWLEKFENSKVYKTLRFVLDWFASVKLPEKKTKK